MKSLIVYICEAIDALSMLLGRLILPQRGFPHLIWLASFIILKKKTSKPHTRLFLKGLLFFFLSSYLPRHFSSKVRSSDFLDIIVYTLAMSEVFFFSTSGSRSSVCNSWKRRHSGCIPQLRALAHTHTLVKKKPKNGRCLTKVNPMRAWHAG